VVDPVAFVGERFRDADFVVIGEHHWVKEQVLFFAGLVEHLPRWGVQDVVLEIGGNGPQAELDAMLASDAFDESVVYEVWRQAPIVDVGFEEYLAIYRRVFETNQTLPPSKRLRIVIANASADFEANDRRSFLGVDDDTHMARVIATEVLERKRKGIMLVGRYHCWFRIHRADGGVAERLGHRLREAYGERVYFAMFDGVVRADQREKRRMCGGLFDLIHPGAYAVDLRRTPFSALGAECDPTMMKITGGRGWRMVDAWEGIIHLNDSAHATGVTPIPGYFDEEIARRMGITAELLRGRHETYTAQRALEAAGGRGKASAEHRGELPPPEWSCPTRKRFVASP
jgi:hypothetical protein